MIRDLYKLVFSPFFVIMDGPCNASQTVFLTPAKIRSCPLPISAYRLTDPLGDSSEPPIAPLVSVGVRSLHLRQLASLSYWRGVRRHRCSPASVISGQIHCLRRAEEFFLSKYTCNLFALTYNIAENVTNSKVAVVGYTQLLLYGRPTYKFRRLVVTDMLRRLTICRVIIIIIIESVSVAIDIHVCELSILNNKFRRLQ